MENKTSFSDKLLIQAAIDYSYRMSRYDIDKDPIEATLKLLKQEFNGRYKAVLIENKPIERKNSKNETYILQIRYLLIEDSHSNPFQHALIYQGSDDDAESIFSGKDTDWSNNLSTAVHLPVKNYGQALDEYQYLVDQKKYNITAAAGNSLGGGYALSLATLNPNLRIIGVNPSPPEFENKFVDSLNSTIINTSTDLLTRMLKTDISRYKEADFKQIKALFSNDQKTAIEKTKEFDELVQSLNYELNYYYGVNTFFVKRSLYYNESLYIEASHRGTILDPREVAIEIFRQNLVPYSSSFASNIFSKTKELLDYSKYFFKLSTNLITNEEYRDLVDNYVEPAFKKVHTNKLQDYKDFSSLTTFLQYDIKTKNIIGSNGYPVVNAANFDIQDKEQFIENLYISISDYRKSSVFALNRVIHDIEEETYMHSKNSTLNPTVTFFASSFNITFNFDLDIVSVFKEVPITILFRIAELLDQNRRYLKGLKNDLLKYFTDGHKEFNDYEVISHYRNVYTKTNQNIRVNLKIISDNLEKLSANLQLVFKSNLSMALGFRLIQGNNALKQFINLENISLDYSLQTEIKLVEDKNLVVDQYEKVLSIIDDYRINTVDELSLNIKKSEEIVKSGISYIDKKSNKKEEYHLDKLSNQLKAMLENVDLATIYYNSLNVFRFDIASIALQNTVAQSIITHYQQLIEANDQLEKMLNNLKLYIQTNTSSIIKERLLKDVNKIETDIYKLNNYIKYFIEK